MSNFYLDVLAKSPHFHSPEVCKDLEMLQPEFRDKVARLIALAANAGHRLQVLETYRSPARQQMLFQKGATKLRNVGVHGYGLAADLGLFPNGKYDPVGEHYAFLVGLCAQVGIISGIDWGNPKAPHSFKDWDHVQGVPLHRQAELFGQSWYPPAGYNAAKDVA